MEIILLRHGKPELNLKGRLNASQIKQLVVVYNQSGIQDSPSETLIKSFNEHYVVCSDLERFIQSAKKFEFKQIHLSDALYKSTFAVRAFSISSLLSM